MGKLKGRNIYPPSQKTTRMRVDESEERTASGDVTGWASHTACQGDNPAVSFAKQNRRGKYRYHGHARGVVFHSKIPGIKDKETFL